MAKTEYTINEKDLTKGELRKLKALRKSIGDELGNEAFVKWYEQQEDEIAADPNVELIEKVLTPHIEKMKFPRGGGYIVKRGRGRIIVTQIE